MASSETDASANRRRKFCILNQKLDNPMDKEAEKLQSGYSQKEISGLSLLQISFQSLGVVSGDLGTSPLYVFYKTFPYGIQDPEDVIGVISLIIYSLILIPLIMSTLSLEQMTVVKVGHISLLVTLSSRKLKAIQDQDRTDEELTTYTHFTYEEHSFAAKTERWLES